MAMFKKVLRWTLYAALLLVLGLALWIGPMTYRAMVGFKTYETVPPVLPADLGSPAILIFSKTNGFRSEEQIQAANKVLEAIAKRQGWASYTTENAAVFNPAQLARFKATVWNSTSGDVLTVQQRADFKGWLEAGGGFVGLHGAGGDPSYAWKWYVDDLIGTQFTGHTLNPHIQQARLVIEDRTHPATKGLGATWTFNDEWYSFAASPRDKGYRILVTIDETSYKPVSGLLPFVEPKSIAMGMDHPLVWSHCVGQGRAFYSALGHTVESYGDAKHQQLILGAIAWALGLEGEDCGAGAPKDQEPKQAP
jgi:uncharacterized protein